MPAKNSLIDDVAKPDKVTPDASSRPLIVGHKPILKDPMVTQDAEEKPVETTNEKPVTRNKTVAPLTPETTAETPPTEPTADTPPASEAASAEATPAPTDSAQASSDDAAVMDALAEQAGADKKDKAASEAELKAQEEIAKHIAEKTYNVPISATDVEKRTQATAWLLLLLVVIFGAVLAVDAGLVDIDITLPFDLIKN